MPFFGIAFGKVMPDLILNGSNPISLKVGLPVRHPKSSQSFQMSVLFSYEVNDFKTGLYAPSVFPGHVRLLSHVIIFVFSYFRRILSCWRSMKS